MATLSASTSVATHRTAPRRSAVGKVLVPLGTALGLLGIAVVLVLPPVVHHPLLDAAGAASRLGVTPSEARALSDLTVTELILGPGTFAIAGPDGRPLYDASEVAHLRDARALLYGFLGLALVCGAAIAVALRRTPGSERGSLWRSVAAGGAALSVGVAVLGIVAAVAFGPAFEVFHRVLFPGGNYAFDLATQRLVQLYPVAFWQLVGAVVGVLAAAMGIGTWWLARRAATRG